jgi:nonsense-mediated mRNA decay protein 3
VCLPAKQAASLGHIGPVVVVTRVTNAITLTDPITLRQAVLEAGAYWRNPLRPMMSSRQLTEFFILDSEIVQPTGGRLAGLVGGKDSAGCCGVDGALWRAVMQSLLSLPSSSLPLPTNHITAPPAGGFGHNPKHALGSCEVARAADFGSNDRTFFAKTHLGNLLHAGDHAVGYDVANANLADPELEKALHKVGGVEGCSAGRWREGGEAGWALSVAGWCVGQCGRRVLCLLLAAATLPTCRLALSLSVLSCPALPWLAHPPAGPDAA